MERELKKSGLKMAFERREKEVPGISDFFEECKEMDLTNDDILALYFHFKHFHRKMNHGYRKGSQPDSCK